MTAAVLTGPAVVTGPSVTTGQGDAPIFRLLVSFDNDIGVPPIWTDLTMHVRTLSYQRGRQFELDQFQAGTLTVSLSNNDGRFSPDNPTGPYYNTLTPMRRVKLVAEWDGVTYPRWAGFAETWEPSTKADGADYITTLKATDAFKSARYVDLSGTYPAALTGDRIQSLLTGLRGIGLNITSSGSVTTQAVTLDNDDPISAAQTAASCEQGFLYCDENGDIRFDDRDYRLVTETTSRIIFGDAPGEAPYSDATYQYTDEWLYTRVAITPDGGAEQVVEDTSKSNEYGQRSLALTIPVQNSVVDSTPNTAWSLALAGFLLEKYHNPTIRITSINVHAGAMSSYWPALLSAPLGARFTVRQRPPFAAAAAAAFLTSTTKVTGTTVTTGVSWLPDKVVYVESITETISATMSNWHINYGFSDADATAYWVLGDNAFSVLGTTTILAFGP